MGGLTEDLADIDRDAVLAFWSRPGEAALIGSVLDDPVALTQAVTAVADRWTHGDCHTGNLLREQRSLVWVDWSEAGVRSPAADLAFSSVRAVPEGAQLPHGAMVAEYSVRRGLEVSAVSTAALAAELMIFLLRWPPYAAFNTAAAVDLVHGRVRQLAKSWLGVR